MSQRNNKDWLNFEKLIERIYRSISPRCEIKHNDYIEGKESGIKRQVDVSIRCHEAGCDLLIIVQAKNFKRPANITHVGEFASVIKDVRASKGVLICNSGFSDVAKKYAADLGIDLCTAHDIENKDWRTTITIPVIWERLIPLVNFAMIAHFEGGDSFSKRPNDWVISEDRGKTRLNLVGTFTKKWNAREIPNTPGSHSLIPSNPNLEILMGENKWRPVQALLCNYVVTRELFRKDVGTSEFSGIRNVLSGNIEVVELGLKIPLPDPQDGWIKLDESFEELLNREYFFISLSHPVILDADRSEAAEFSIEFLGGNG